MECPECHNKKTSSRVIKEEDRCKVLRSCFCPKCHHSFTTIEKCRFDDDACIEIACLPIISTEPISGCIVERRRVLPDRRVVTIESLYKQLRRKLYAEIEQHIRDMYEYAMTEDFRLVQESFQKAIMVINGER